MHLNILWQKFIVIIPMLVSRDIRLQPFTNQQVSVYTFCLGAVTSQDIHFIGSLPTNDCVFLSKTYIKCGLIMVYHCLDEIGPQGPCLFFFT